MLDRKEHDKAVLTDLADWLEKLDLVDEDEREGARENITVMVETLLSRLHTATAPSGQAPLEGVSADDLRAQGWTVAVHNDYRLNGEPHTFWLFTKDGRAIKGEGRTDAEALEQVRAALLAASAEPVGRLRFGDYPIGTKVFSCIGGHWTRVETGWKALSGDVFPRPGGDAFEVELPPASGAVEGAPLRYCGYCKSWNSKPCGNGCVWTPGMPTSLPAAPTEGR